jgi:hypothetical protein
MTVLKEQQKLICEFSACFSLATLMMMAIVLFAVFSRTSLLKCVAFHCVWNGTIVPLVNCTKFY